MDTEGIFVWAWRGPKKARLSIGRLEDIIGQIKSIDPLAIEPLDAIDPPESIIGPLECIVDPPESIGRLECINGRLECVDPLVIGRLATEPPEFIIGLLAIDLLDIDLLAIDLLDIDPLGERETDHAVVLEVLRSHDMLVAANNHVKHAYGHDTLTLPEVER
ncbi:MAG: hypothetical protein E6K99_08325 [Thaumarchaeota archaeon]|nr:MAG: hypothetical protein E6K99_08325 [Nitrososphaerota archaeon]